MEGKPGYPYFVLSGIIEQYDDGILKYSCRFSGARNITEIRRGHNDSRGSDALIADPWKYTKEP
jgi:hypothetical protein